MRRTLLGTWQALPERLVGPMWLVRLGFAVSGFGFRVSGFRFRVWVGYECRVEGVGVEARVQDLGFRGWGVVGLN